MTGPMPPAGVTTPFLPQLLLTVGCATGAAIALVYAVQRFRRDGSPILLLLILGTTIAYLQEAALDLVVSAYYPPEGLWGTYEAYGRTIPLWALFAWWILFAAAPYKLAQSMRKGHLRRTAWLGVGGLALVDVLIEMPCLSVNLYYYYGDQPLRVGGLPLAMVVVNCATMMAVTVAVYLGENRLRGRLRYLAITVPILAAPAGTMSTGLPVWTAIAAQTPSWISHLAALLSIGLALWAVHGMISLAEHYGTASHRLPAAVGQATPNNASS